MRTTEVNNTFAFNEAGTNASSCPIVLARGAGRGGGWQGFCSGGSGTSLSLQAPALGGRRTCPPWALVLLQTMTTGYVYI